MDFGSERRVKNVVNECFVLDAFNSLSWHCWIVPQSFYLPSTLRRIPLNVQVLYEYFYVEPIRNFSCCSFSRFLNRRLFALQNVLLNRPASGPPQPVHCIHQENQGFPETEGSEAKRPLQGARQALGSPKKQEVSDESGTHFPGRKVASWGVGT